MTPLNVSLQPGGWTTCSSSQLAQLATGVYAVWYPQVQRPESKDLPRQLQHLAGKGWLHATLKVMAPSRDGLGLHGSGVFVFNPPWKLQDSLRDAMPALVRLLGQDRKASYSLEGKQT